MKNRYFAYFSILMLFLLGSNIFGQKTIELDERRFVDFTEIYRFEKTLPRYDADSIISIANRNGIDEAELGEIIRAGFFGKHDNMAIAALKEDFSSYENRQKSRNDRTMELYCRERSIDYKEYLAYKENMNATEANKRHVMERMISIK